MRKRVLAVALVTLTVGLTGPASAQKDVELVSPSLVASPSNVLECRIVNMSSQARDVHITSFDSNGVLVGDNTITVAPNAWGGTAVSGPAGYCKFSISGGHGRQADQFRASIDVFKPGFGIISALPAN